MKKTILLLAFGLTTLFVNAQTATKSGLLMRSTFSVKCLNQSH